MISRQWRGLVKAACSDDYVEHLKTETFPQLRKLSGFVDATIYRRDVDKGVEFLIETRWESLASIRKFSGDNVEAAVVPANVRDMMLDFETVARHYTVVE